MRFISNFDERMIAMCQEAYLWLWDRFDIYIGTLIFVSLIGEHGFEIWRRGGQWSWFFDVGLLGVLGLRCSVLWAAQWRGFLTYVNAAARSWAEFQPRSYIVVTVAAFCFAMDAAHGQPSSFVSDVLFVVWNYLSCVQVRPRDPKDLFPSRLRLAGAGA